MTRHSDQTRVENMLDHACEAADLAQGRSRADLDTGRVFNLALTRLLAIVGYAAARVSEPTRSQHLQIPWQAIAGLRNRLIHGYDEVDFDVLWDVVQNDLRSLIANLQAIVGGNPSA